MLGTHLCTNWATEIFKNSLSMKSRFKDFYKKLEEDIVDSQLKKGSRGVIPHFSCGTKDQDCFHILFSCESRIRRSEWIVSNNNNSDYRINILIYEIL